jgi:RHS repeat-associated protein
MLHNSAGCVTNIVYTGSGYSENIGLTWNGQYQLTEVTTNGSDCERYGYDALGRRVWSWNGTETNYFVYDGVHILAEVDSTGGLRRAYTHGPSSTGSEQAGIDNWLAMTVYTGATAKTYFYLTDHQGTVHAVADETGSIAESYRFDAWGRVLGVYDETGSPITKTKIGNRLLFQGREYSWETGFYYFRARFYDPITGRWLSNDPIGISGGLDQYVFVANNPLAFRDPFGLKIRLLGTPEQQQLLLTTLRQFVRGELNMHEGGYLTRKTCPNDGAYDDMISDLINSKHIYDITLGKRPDGKVVIGGQFVPSYWDGGTIYLDPKEQPLYATGLLSPQEPGTLGTTLAHELVHAAQNREHKPGAEWDAFNVSLQADAISRANVVYPRMNKPLRTQ